MYYVITKNIIFFDLMHKIILFFDLQKKFLCVNKRNAN